MTRSHRTPILLTTFAGLLAPGFAVGHKPVEQTRTHTTTHRVVVVNGETIVEEKTVNGKLVPSKDRVQLERRAPVKRPPVKRGKALVRRTR